MEISVPNERDTYVKVKTFDGLWDEKAEALSCNINKRVFCWKHNWINASLRWGGTLDNYHVEICEVRGKDSTGYGTIRFCKKCKLIDCMHWWKTETTYEIDWNKYYSETTTVKLCSRCNLRINTGGGGQCHPSEEASKLISEVMKELHDLKYPKGADSTTGVGMSYLGGHNNIIPGNTYPGDYDPFYSYGSGFFIELPITVSRMLEYMDREVVRNYVIDCCKNGISDSAMLYSLKGD